MVQQVLLVLLDHLAELVLQEVREPRAEMVLQDPLERLVYQVQLAELVPQEQLVYRVELGPLV